MRDALLNDLADMPVEISTTVDARLAPPAHCKNYTLIHANDDIWQIWTNAILQADAVWVISPETDGILLKFATLTKQLGKVWLGCDIDTIDMCGDKLKTAGFLQKNGVPVPTFTLETFLAYDSQYPTVLWKNNGRYVGKPRLGAGCEDTVLFNNIEKLSDFMQAGRANSHLIQAYIEGQAASICMLCVHGRAWLLSCNQQLISENNGVISYHGSVVNGLKQHWQVFERLAEALAAWLPGLHGFVGIDIVIGEKGNKDTLFIIEINPRLTTSYAGLRQSIKQNPAKLYLETLQNPAFKMPKITQKSVTIHV